MGRTRSAYPAGFRRQIIELVREVKRAVFDLSKGSTIRDAVTHRSAVFHRSTTNAGTTQRLSFPTHISLPPCSRPSKDKPFGRPQMRPSLTAAPLGSRVSARVGTEEWLRRGRTKECQQTKGPHGLRSRRMIPSSHLFAKPGQVHTSLRIP
jgi:hypothetical protein